MSRVLIILACSVLVAWPVYAGIWWKKSKPNPQRVSELVGILLNHPDAAKRADAASELAEADAAAHPEVVHALIEALRQDGSTSVRRAAVSSLGKLQPPTIEAAEALEQAIQHDDSWTVRLQARMACLGYRVPKQANSPIQANSVPGPQHSPARPLPLLAPSATRPASSHQQSVPASSGSLPVSDSNPLLLPGVQPSNLELAPPPRIHSPTGSPGKSDSNLVVPYTAPSSPALVSPAKPTLLAPKSAKVVPSLAAKATPSSPLARPESATRPEEKPNSGPASSMAPRSTAPAASPPEPPGPILIPPPQ